MLPFIISYLMLWEVDIKRKPYGWQVCEEGLLELWDRRSQQEESVLMHLSTIWFSFYDMVLLNLCI